MQLFLRTPTKHYFISLFLVVSVLFTTFSVAIYRQYNQAQQLNSWIIYNYEVNRQCRRILSEIVNMETGVRGYLLTGQKIFLEPYESAKTFLPGLLDQLHDFAKDDASTHKNIEEWRSKVVILNALFERQIQLYHVKDMEDTASRTLVTQKAEMDGLRLLLEGYIRQRLDSLEEQILDKNATSRNFRYILTIGSILALGGMLLTTLVIITLVERNRRAELEAKTVETRLLQVVNGINDGLFDFNLLDASMYFSPAYKEMLGCSEEEHPNTVEMFNKTIHPDDFEQVWAVLRNYQEGKTSIYSNIYRLQHKDGHWISVLSRGVGLKNPQGLMTRLIGTHLDITEHRNREEALKQLNNEIETFAYITSHDLRVPLVNIRGFAGEIEHAVAGVKAVAGKIEQTLAEKDRKILSKAFDEDIPESIRFITQSVNKMDTLTSALLDLSRIGKRNYKTETVDMQQIVQQALDSLAYEINQKNIEVVVHKLPTVVSNPLAMEQIVSNILDNAVKYLDPARRGRIVISSMQAGRDTVFAIGDNGRGIMDADKDKVFQIFRRARNTLDVHGVGMGMTFVQATLRHMGGTIWFDSTPDVGTTFYFSLSRHAPFKGQRGDMPLSDQRT